jgi:hypothetical protein
MVFSFCLVTLGHVGQRLHQGGFVSRYEMTLWNDPMRALLTWSPSWLSLTEAVERFLAARVEHAPHGLEHARLYSAFNISFCNAVPPGHLGERYRGDIFGQSVARRGVLFGKLLKKRDSDLERFDLILL